ncbi:hypothetical protein LJC42_03805 [Eubacteriales bacterium OttesenSCG-928-K08]|nr:hypothetical protein [Eubacteriales bacterium OttesenSCG-928-K08]
MYFTPKPENIFETFLEVYYAECRKKAPQIEAIAGKWKFEDLIPGMSDFDTRFICSNQTTDADWCKMSMAVGMVHLELCREHPEWARILEHLPGVNPTWDEMQQEPYYYPEYRQWSLYRSSNSHDLEKTIRVLDNRPWDLKDEYFFLKKFLSFYGPYNRGIDPAINLGEFENKYPLHSRAMHYFTPPVQAAVSILERRPVKGKLESLQMAQRMFPEIKVFDRIAEMLQVHYELPHLYKDPALGDFEQELQQALDIIWEKLRTAITCVPDAGRMTAQEVKKEINSVPISPLMALFDSSKFCRLFKGRLYFYVNAPAHFDNIWLIQNELSRCGAMFYRSPFQIYWKAVHGQELNDPDEITRRLGQEGILTVQEVQDVLTFSRLTPGTWKDGAEISIAREIECVFDSIFIALSKVKRDMIAREGGNP